MMIMRESRWNNDDYFVPNQHIWLDFSSICHWNNSLLLDMSLYLDTLSWFRVNQSLLFLLNIDSHYHHYFIDFLSLSLFHRLSLIIIIISSTFSHYHHYFIDSHYHHYFIDFLSSSLFHWLSLIIIISSTLSLSSLFHRLSLIFIIISSTICKSDWVIVV
jgi:hypothetical protein